MDRSLLPALFYERAPGYCRQAPGRLELRYFGDSPASHQKRPPEHAVATRLLDQSHHRRLSGQEDQRVRHHSNLCFRPSQSEDRHIMDRPPHHRPGQPAAKDALSLALSVPRHLQHILVSRSLALQSGNLYIWSLPLDL